MGGGFLYLFIPVFMILLVVGVMALLITIFYAGEWWEKKQKAKRLQMRDRLDELPPPTA